MTELSHIQEAHNGTLSSEQKYVQKNVQFLFLTIFHPFSRPLTTFTNVPSSIKSLICFIHHFNTFKNQLQIHLFRYIFAKNIHPLSIVQTTRKSIIQLITKLFLTWPPYFGHIIIKTRSNQ